LHLSPEVTDAVPHSADADTGSTLVDSCQFFFRNAFAMIFNLNRDFVGLAGNSNDGDITAGMAQDVREAFLHDPKHGKFGLRWQSLEVVRDVQFDLE